MKIRKVRRKDGAGITLSTAPERILLRRRLNIDYSSHLENDTGFTLESANSLL